MKKILIQYTNENSNRIFPRDVRNYIGSIVDEEYKRLFMWHERSSSPFIYGMPRNGYMSIYTYRNDMDEAIAHACDKIIENQSLKMAGINGKIDSVMVKNTDYSTFQNGMYEYNCRTPIIVGNIIWRHNEFREIMNSKSQMDLVQFVRSAIAETVSVHTRHYFDEEIDISDSLMIMPKEPIKPFFHKYKDDRWYPAVNMSFISNMRLPQFIGYKIGMGYGEIALYGNSKKKGAK